MQVCIDTTWWIVLILIFLENALRRNKIYDKTQELLVLILIFLENALRPLIAGGAQPGVNNVLILIFLENALRQELKTFWDNNWNKSLNPYFFGKCSTA